MDKAVKGTRANKVCWYEIGTFEKDPPVTLSSEWSGVECWDGMGSTAPGELLFLKRTAF